MSVVINYAPPAPIPPPPPRQVASVTITVSLAQARFIANILGQTYGTLTSPLYSDLTKNRDIYDGHRERSNALRLAGLKLPSGDAIANIFGTA